MVPTSATGDRRHFIGALATFVLVAAGVAMWVVRRDVGTLLDQLRRSSFWILEVQAVLAAALTIHQAPRLVRLIRPAAGDIRAVTAASIAALVLAAMLAPRANRIFYDEQIYQSIGQNLTDLKLTQMCNDGTVQYGRLQCWRPEYNKEPNGYAYLLSAGYRIAGVHEWVAFTINNLSAAAMVWVVFAATALLFGIRAGVWAAAIAALLPEQLMWANSAASEPTTALACAAAMMTAAYFVQSRDTMSLCWAAAMTVFAAQFRPEAALIAPLVASVIVIGAPRELLRPRLWWIAAGAIVLAAPLAAHHFAFRRHSWDAPGVPAMSFGHVATNLPTNGWFYLWDERFPAMYTALALVGVAVAKRRAVIIPVMYFAAFWAVFLVFYAGSYNWGQNVRYSLSTYPPIAMLAGAGLSAIVARLDRAWRFDSKAATVAAAALILQFFWYVPLVRAIGEEAWGARADVAFAREMAATLPRDSIVLTHNPGMFHVWGVNAAQASLATTDEGYVRGVLFSRYAGGVYLHWNFWCNIQDPVQQRFCTDILERFGGELVREKREWSYRYAFYRLSPAFATPPQTQTGTGSPQR